MIQRYFFGKVLLIPENCDSGHLSIEDKASPTVFALRKWMAHIATATLPLLAATDA